MKKGLLALMVGLMVLGASMKANAQSARLLGMGANVYGVEDLDMVFLFPNKALEYSNIVNFRGLVPAGGEYGGLILKDDAIGGMGLFTNVPAASVVPGQGQADSAANHNRFDLLWGNNFSGTTFGVALNYSATSSDSNPNYDRDMGINLGLGLTADTFSQIDIHLRYDMGQQYALGKSTSNAPSVIDFGGLAQKDLDANNDLRMFADVNLGSNAGYVANSSATTVMVGLAGNRKVNDGKGLVSTGLMINYGSVTGFADDCQLLWFGSVESKVADWLTLRTGGQARLYDATGNAGFAFATGASINWQNFVLDLNVNPASLENSITNVNPGNGLIFTENNGNLDHAIVTVSQADLSYKF
jgi:hypothetical protein